MSARLQPSRASVQYAVRKPLLDWLAGQDVRGLRVLDVGCGDRPYEALLAGAAEIVAFDVPGNPHADLHGSIDAIPVENASFDVVLCLQVLEHVADPPAAVRELRRAVRPGGRVLLSTHGVYPFHPNPDDLWRWTHDGLDRLFRANGDWSSVTVPDQINRSRGVNGTATNFDGMTVSIKSRIFSSRSLKQRPRSL